MIDGSMGCEVSKGEASFDLSKVNTYSLRKKPELNWIVKRNIGSFLYSVIIPKPVKVNKVTHRQIETWGEVQNHLQFFKQ